ncbi:glycosyltransferase family 4 protein [Alkalimarinus sediminis]|uniref:Glycosyltransferase family 4 protein n=1 Tax=Alkalimarinus sediminis TaxID=1632866 RepID=A0A9E8KHZ9_9ALTE|nr:glycosyltransferase family 4 protein [Alkalimarinus sediminis]UZW73416.1 glycosyltransferase family 4 protein [Alkalimarinus sediminis]
MRIALLPDDYLPDSTLVHAKMFHELAIEFKRLGHDPVIITPGSVSQSKRLLVDKIDEIEIWRFRTGKTRGVGKLKRAINESLLSLNAWLAIRESVKSCPFDLIVNYSPTIFFGPLVNRIKKANPTCRSYLILRDMFPQWVIDEGMISEGSLIARYFRFFENYNYRNSDIIGLMSEANEKYFKSMHPQYRHLEILRNWSQVVPVSVDSKALDIRATYNLHDKVVFFYGGNIGHAQDMANIMRLARNLIKNSNAHFLLVGQGDEVDLIHRLKAEWDLQNVTILPSVDQGTYKQLLKQVDVGLFSLAKSHKAHNFPGKLLGYMLESLPILGSLNPGNDLVEFINKQQAGFAFINGDDEALVGAALELLNSETLRNRQGGNAFRVLTEYFSVESAAAQIIKSVGEKGKIQ